MLPVEADSRLLQNMFLQQSDLVMLQLEQKRIDKRGETELLSQQK